MLEIARIGQYSSRSDVEVGIAALEAGLFGACRNVLINLPGIEDADFRRDMEERAAGLLARGHGMRARIQTLLDARTGDA
jgi:glutamate formiminotransferase/formiminotetrahydrofolate cyclodeaminase